MIDAKGGRAYTLRVPRFDDATAVKGGDGLYRAELDPEWTVSGNPHGGYLLATMARAAIASDDPATHPYPLSASAVYVTAPEVGPATIEVEVLRRGRLASQVRARLTQDDRPRVEALFTVGNLDDTQAPAWVDGPPVDVAAPSDCVRNPVEPPGSGVRVAMLDMVEQRLDADAMQATPGDIRGWLAFEDGSALDPVALLYAVDGFPPATFTLGSVGWVPTLELTAYIRGVPAPGYLRVRQRARLLAGSLVDQVCDIWDSRGRIVAQATQLAAVRMPAGLSPA